MFGYFFSISLSELLASLDGGGGFIIGKIGGCDRVSPWCRSILCVRSRVDRFIRPIACRSEFGVTQHRTDCECDTNPNQRSASERSKTAGDSHDRTSSGPNSKAV